MVIRIVINFELLISIEDTKIIYEILQYRLGRIKKPCGKKNSAGSNTRGQITNFLSCDKLSDNVCTGTNATNRNSVRGELRNEFFELCFKF